MINGQQQYINYWHVNNPIDYMTSQISQNSLMDSAFEKPYVQKYNQTGPQRKKKLGMV
jgi:hypothetical protein